ncbi:unnamed protein product, partial [Urochloa humidicola]
TVPTSHLCCRPRSYHARRRFSLLLRPPAPHAPTPSAAGPRTAAPPHPRPLEIARSRSRPSLVLLPALAPADAVALPYPPPKRSGATWLPAPGASPTPPQRMELFDGMVQPIFRSTGSSRCGNSPRLVESQRGSLLEGPLGAYSEVRRRGFKQQRRPPPPTRSRSVPFLSDGQSIFGEHCHATAQLEHLQDSRIWLARCGVSVDGRSGRSKDTYVKLTPLFFPGSMTVSEGLAVSIGGGPGSIHYVPRSLVYCHGI